MGSAEQRSETGLELNGDGGAPVVPPEKQPSKLEVERYINSVTAAVDKIAAVERSLNELVDEGWPTKMRGDRTARLDQLSAAAAEAEAATHAVDPTNPVLSGIHVNLRELAEAYSRVFAAAGAIEDTSRSPEETKAMLAAKEDADREVDEFIQPLRELGARSGADLAPIGAAIQAGERTFGERLARFGMRLLRPFTPISRPTPRRLLVMPFMPPYGPLAPPQVLAFSLRLSGLAARVPVIGRWFWLLGLLWTISIGLALSAAYYSLLLGWWLVAGWWISLIVTARMGSEV